MTGERLRIVHAIRAKPPGEIGGADLHVADLAGQQTARGHEVTVVCLGPAELTGVLRDRKIPHIAVPSMSMLDWTRRLSAAVALRTPDLVHSHGYRADLVVDAVGRRLFGKAPWSSAMTAHGFIRTSVAMRALTRANEHVLRRADTVLATSVAEAERLGRLLGRLVTFVPNGVAPFATVPRSTALTALGIATSRCVAFSGRISPEKRPDLFLEMAGLLAYEYPDTSFAVIGSGPAADRLRKLANAGGIPRVVITGLLPESASLLSGVDVLVCPSDTEGTPRVVIEAMHAGVPVVATRVGGLPDLISDGRTGVLVEPGSARSLAGAVGALLDRPAVAAQIAERAQAIAARRFSAAAMEEETARAYAHGLKGRR